MGCRQFAIIVHTIGGLLDKLSIRTIRLSPQNIQTWLFEDGTFTPFAKLTENKSYAVVTDHLGSPKELINQNGKVAWKSTLDMYGMVRSLAGGTTTDSKCNFRFPGQYEDEETGLCYNRFRYYMPSEGMYTQRDPIGLAGGNPTVYGYTWNSLLEIDPWGLSLEFLNRKLKALEKAQNNAASTRILSDGRVRYYGSIVAARTPGLTAGATLATEFNPNNSNVRQWLESYDHSGNVNRVHPKMRNGEILDLPHYPPIGSEIQSNSVVRNRKGEWVSNRCR